ncbi:MAG: hypothetical protein ABIG30_03335, partial [Candidatus Aenigmatarchaeota archaeon]
FGEFHTIGIVRNAYDKNSRRFFEIEDITGSITLSFDPTKTDLENISVDDVAGFSGVVRNKIIFGKQIILPDMPLRKPTLGYGRICCISDLHLDEAPTKDIEKMFQWLGKSNTEYVFIVGKIGDFAMLKRIMRPISGKTVFLVSSDNGFPSAARNSDMENVIDLGNPSLIELNGVKILLSTEANVSMLKKRYIGKSSVPYDSLILDDIPDIILYAGAQKPFVENYKSITLVTAGSTLTEFLPYIINLGTRDYGQIFIDKLK